MGQKSIKANSVLWERTQEMLCWASNTSSASQGSVSIAGSPTPIVRVNTWAQSEHWDLQLQSKHTKLELLYTIKQCSLHRLSWPVKNLHSRLILFRGAAVSSRPGGWEPSLLSTQALLKTLLRSPPELLNLPRAQQVPPELQHHPTIPCRKE